MTSVLGQFLVACLFTLGFAIPSVVMATSEIYLGSVAMDVPAAMVKRLAPLTDYLSAKTGYRVSFRAAPSLSSAVNDLGMGNTQIAYLTPVAYIEAHEKYNALPLVQPLTDGKPTFNLVIVVREDSPLTTPLDLRGKTFAFGDEKALLQRAVVVESGVQLEELKSYAFLKHYDNVAKAVLHGDFDAGILRDTLAEKFRPEGLRIIHTSPDLPSYVFAVNKRMPKEAITKFKQAFLDLKPNTPANRAILNALDPGYSGFVLAKDHDYDTVRELTAPFKKSGGKPESQLRH